MILQFKATLISLFRLPTMAYQPRVVQRANLLLASDPTRRFNLVHEANLITLLQESHKELQRL